MTYNLKYRRPLPIKAQSGAIFIDARAQKAKQENARRRAIADNYFNQAPSIPNLAKGVYYWATSQPWLFGEDEHPEVNKGVVPAVAVGAGSVTSIPKMAQIIRQVGPTAAAVSAWLGGHFLADEATPTAPKSEANSEQKSDDTKNTSANNTANNTSNQNSNNTSNQNSNKNSNAGNTSGSNNTSNQNSNKKSKLDDNGYKVRSRKWLKKGLKTTGVATAIGLGLDIATNIRGGHAPFDDDAEYFWTGYTPLGLLERATRPSNQNTKSSTATTQPKDTVSTRATNTPVQLEEIDIIKGNPYLK